MSKFEIIDFHTHPFLREETNICSHKEYCNMSAENTLKTMTELGVSKICGSVIGDGKRIAPGGNTWSVIRSCNDEALALRELYGDFYIPGFHVHPDFVRESCEEIEHMHALGVNLIGELVPYSHGGWHYDSKGFDEILDTAGQYHMTVSFHSMNFDEMENMVKKHPNIVFVAAHPGEYNDFMRHMEIMKLSGSYYLDLSGYGIFRHGMLRHAIDKFGAERFLYGSDYPTCNPAMYLGGVLLDSLITDREKELIFAGNAKRLLKL